MEPADCSRALAAARPGVAFGEPRPILGGWSFWTFAVDNLIVRFPVSDSDAECMRREMRLLPEVARALPVAVPEYILAGDWGGRPFGAYRAIAGIALDADGVPEPGDAIWTDLGRVLRELHAFPLARVRAVLGPTADDEALTGEADAKAISLLRPELQRTAREEIARYLARDRSRDAALTHNDLGLVHVLAEGGRITGIIDWSDACIGDPAKDFVGILSHGGWPSVRTTIDAYGPVAADFEQRVAFFAWVAPIHDILYGLTTDQPEHVADGIRGVERRMRLAGLIA
jgi:aminoglycoside 2''-phosphotransferase